MQKTKIFLFTLFAFLLLIPFNKVRAELYLRDNLKRAHTGDYIVTSQNKNYTLLHVYSRDNQKMTLEEITIPIKKFPESMGSWKNWIQNNAPGNTSWILYTVDLNTGKLIDFYSVTKHRSFNVQEANSFLSILLNLPFQLIPLEDRKRVGFPSLPGMTDKRPFWQPQMKVEGREIFGVWFDGWKSRWPRDDSDLSEKTIEIFVPQESNKYPSYFPYWLQVSGIIGKAKVRIVDSGSGLKSPIHKNEK